MSLRMKIAGKFYEYQGTGSKAQCQKAAKILLKSGLWLVRVRVVPKTNGQLCEVWRRRAKPKNRLHAKSKR